MEQNKSAEVVLKESEKRYRELFENSLAGVFRTTKSGEMLDCNESYRRIFGFTNEEIHQGGGTEGTRGRPQEALPRVRHQADRPDRRVRRPVRSRTLRP